MSNLVVSSDFNLANPQDFFGQHPIRSNMSSTGFDVYFAENGNNIHINGQNIQYGPNGDAVSGTVTGITCLTGNGQETLFNLTNANINLQDANDQNFPNFGAEVNYWLGPNPTITQIPGGMAGSETIAAPSGINNVYGYTGNNKVVYSAPSTQFTIDVDNLFSSANGTLTVTQGDPLTSGNSNTLHAIQSIQFSDMTIDTSWLTGASLLHSTQPEEFSVLSEIYLAYFNRAPDALGLDFWAAGAYNIHNSQPNLSWSEINGMIANVFSGTPEAISTFGTVTSQSTTAELQNFVTRVYDNVLNRAPEEGGLNFWVDALHSGACSPGSFIRDIINSVNQQTGTADKIYLSSKDAVGEYFAVTAGLTDTVQAQNVMQTFNATYDTSGATAAINAANALTDFYYSAPSLQAHSELIVHLAGVHPNEA